MMMITIIVAPSALFDIFASPTSLSPRKALAFYLDINNGAVGGLAY
jgi:hypothetical protein